MIKFNTIGQIEHTYAFEDAVVETDVFNGVFGTVSDKKFTPSAVATKAVMQVENGDDAGLPKYKIPAGSHVRVVNLEAFVDQAIEVYDYPLPDAVSVGDKLESDTDGSLKVNSGATGLYLEVTKIIGNKQGVEAIVRKNA